MIGQINRGTKTGDFIYNLCLQDDVLFVLEIGTWNGMGSTKCIGDAILSRNDASYFLTIESSRTMYETAKTLWANCNLQNKINFIHGKIIEKQELIPIEEIRSCSNYTPDWDRWYEEDLKNMEACKNIIDQIPDKIDLLLLDGGEFSTFSEFKKLHHRSKYILCDDTNTLKCNEIVKILLADKNFELIFNNQNDGRNGFMAFKRK
jgi:hypothetical protein